VGSVYSFLDKEFLSINPARGRLYMSYTEFGVVSNFDTIEVAVCDIGTPGGGKGPNGGTADSPVCHNGAEQSSVTGTATPYFVVALTPSDCAENEGAYPAVDVKSGVLYVAYEHNWASNLAGYNRFPMNDFPRLAASDASGTVSMIWNDARLHPAGDILCVGS
jgi:hypothetical protein